MSHQQSPASPFVDLRDDAHNVTPQQVSDAVARLQQNGAAGVAMRIVGFGSDPGGIADGPDSAYGTDLCKPDADGTTDLSYIIRAIAKAPINGARVAVQVRQLDTVPWSRESPDDNGGGAWQWASDALQAAD